MSRKRKPRRVKADKPAKEEVPLSEEQKKLVEDHLGLVEYLAAMLATRSIPIEDRRHDGIMGLIDAAKGWDPEQGVKFATYAGPRVMGAILDAERAGEGVVIRIGKTQWAGMTPEERDASQPTRLAWIKRRWRDKHREGIPTAIEELPAPVEAVAFDPEKLSLLVDRLGGKQADAVRLYYWSGLTMKAVARCLDISESRVSQMHSDAIERLRANPRIREAVAG